jgi:hypothetical protein
MSKHFRQTFKPDGPDKLITSVMRETNDGVGSRRFQGASG